MIPWETAVSSQAGVTVPGLASVVNSWTREKSRIVFSSERNEQNSFRYQRRSASADIYGFKRLIYFVLPELRLPENRKEVAFHFLLTAAGE